ncbi:hypothetical protein NDGK_01394 [Clostridiales bacterium CHKCI001]|nr:hypothetical protein NDGK_01394 [Clostridiales bacterium CHKCI001]
MKTSIQYFVENGIPQLKKVKKILCKIRTALKNM